MLNDEGAFSFNTIRNKCFDCFDEEMAGATIERFKKLNMGDKKRFRYEFKNLFESSIRMSSCKLEETRKGLSILKNSLNEYLDVLKKKGKRTYENVHTENFITVIDGLLRVINEQKN